MPDKKTIRAIVKTAVESYADGFQTRHIAEKSNPEGTLNMKIHNVFIEALGDEIQYYTALVRSLDSSLGNMLETMAMNLASLTFDVKKSVEGPLSPEQTSKIAELLEAYKRRIKRPSSADYQSLRKLGHMSSQIKRHDSDYYLVDSDHYTHYLIELKIGGDLDNKKARAEKEAILEQYSILSNILERNSLIKIYFATAYNRYGENNLWRQERVRQFFSDDELLIGKDFWNFICRSENGYAMIIEAYRDNASVIKKALQNIKLTYLR